MQRSGSPSKNLLLAGVAAAVMAAGVSSAAVAADKAVATNSSEIETLVVTARKRTERLMDVPVSANVLSDQTLRRYATSDLTALSTQLPQVTISTTNAGPGAVLTI